jgi:DNA gyrase inhibitor GyrI
MSALNVRIEKLEPMRVASVRVISVQPESEAWERLKAWADPRGLLEDPQRHPVFGFNSPNPSPDGPEYGYEYWIRVERDVASGEPVHVKEVAGGRYAVLTHRGYPSPQVWKQLWDWAQNSGYQWRNAQELERIHDPLAAETDVMFDLYLPIED